MQFLNSPYLNQATAASVLMKPVAEKFTCKGLIRELKFWESNVLLDDFQNQSVGYPERPTDKQLDLIGQESVEVSGLEQVEYVDKKKIFGEIFRRFSQDFFVIQTKQ